MANEKLFNTIGVSTLNGETKVRFANDASRVKVLQKNGHTDILLITLSEALTKLEAVRAIVDLPEFQDPAAQEAIAEFLTKNEPKAQVETKTQVETQDSEKPVAPKVAKVKDPAVRVRAKAKKLKEALPNFDEQGQTVDEDEEVPF